MSEPFAFVDYRKDGHVTVEKLDDDKCKITLKFFLQLVDDEDDSTDRTTILNEWCSEWSADDVVKDFMYRYDVIKYSWVSQGVFEMIIGTNDSYTADDMYYAFREDSLEDGAYEGDPDDSFWIIPEN